MRYFLDTEFVNDNELHLLSIAIVCEDGRELYLINSEYENLKGLDEFVDEYVMPNLMVTDTNVKTLDEIKHAIIEFFGDDYDIVIYGDYSAYDYVLFSRLFGGFENYPRHYPMYFRDIMFFRNALCIEGNPDTSYEQGHEHNALSDARLVQHRYEIFKEMAGYPFRDY